MKEIKEKYFVFKITEESEKERGGEKKATSGR
jgi:hypothetical protein